MSRTERFGQRDMAYSRWHRDQTASLIGQAAADALDLIDLDWVEFCHGCWEPLALFETAIDVGQARKTAEVTRRLAERANLPAFVVLYRLNGDFIDRFRVRQIAPEADQSKEHLLTPETYAKKVLLQLIRDQHICRRAA